MGLTNSGATFQRFIDDIFKEFLGKFLMVNIDDIIVYSETIEEHIEHIKQAFDVIRKHNLKIKIKKCTFFQASNEFLVHVVSNGEIKPSIYWYGVSLSKIHQRFCENNTKFNWDEKCQDAFDQSKNALTSESVLMIPDFEKRFYLETDASNKGIGEVLSQMDENNQLRPIAYYLRKLSKSEQNYSASEKEILAIVNAL
ncbi:unnamed protein product [Brachionus calyciflorus]|uniref:Reverse transcriptase domain-containing protein n=1 Tax=Brachionus calyciflorus TaxID=104777 RepID=A0A814GCV1_9BILA|nr:unnamed protein product [Brachionus calyciflorus]